MNASISAAVAASSPHVSKAVPLIIAFVAGLGAIALSEVVGTDALEQARLAARWTARTSFLIFLVVYSASALVRLFPAQITKALLRHRRQWGLGFALAHTIHLGALTHYMLLSGETRPVPVWILTSTAYVFIFAMALTSNDESQRLLGKWWKRLHRVGIHYIWLIFFLSYASRLADPARRTIGLVFVPATLAALGLRIVAHLSARRSVRRSSQPQRRAAINSPAPEQLI